MTVASDLFGSSGAVLSPDEKYRYLLTRERAAGPGLVFIMLNPSTADDKIDDPTIRRCIKIADRENAGRLVVVNLFALRATDPRELARHPDPVGKCNDEFILIHCTPGTRVVAAWGNGGRLLGRDAAVRAMLANAGVQLTCLGVTGSGQPKHPLARGREYIPADAPLLPYPAPEVTA